jgi:hypothetical protein
MGRCGKYGLGQQILPVAGEVAARDHLCAGDRAPAAEADDQDIGIRVQCGRAAQRDGFNLQPAQRAQQTESGLVVVSHYLGRHHTLAGQQDLGLDRLQDQIADGQHQAVIVNDHAGAGACGAKHRGGAGVRGNDRTDPDHGVERPRRGGPGETDQHGQQQAREQAAV